MNIETKERIKNIQAEGLNHINEYISKIELILLNKFDQNQIKNILKFEREQIFEDIELAEIISKKFDIPSIIEKRESMFFIEMRNSEENQVLSFLNFEFISRFFKNFQQSSPIFADKNVESQPIKGIERFLSYFLLFPIILLALVPGLDIDTIFFSQFFLLSIFSIYVNIIKSSMKNHLFTLYSIGLMTMLVTATIRISGVFGKALITGNNPEEASAGYALIYSSILYFGLIWKINDFESSFSNKNNLSNGKYYLIKIVYTSIITTILTIITGIYVFVRAGLTLESNNIYPIVEFVVLTALIFYLRNRFISPEQKIKENKLEVEFTFPPNLKDKTVKVTIDKKKYQEFANVKILSKKKLLVLLVSMTLITMGTYFNEISTIKYNTIPNITNGYITLNHGLATNLSYLVGLAFLSLYLILFVIQIIYRLSRSESRTVIHNLSLRGNLMTYEEFYSPSLGMTNSKYVRWLGELTYQNIISIELQE